MNVNLLSGGGGGGQAVRVRLCLFYSDVDRLTDREWDARRCTVVSSFVR